MADPGGSEKGSVVESGDFIPEIKGLESLSGVGGAPLPEIRRSERTKGLRNVLTRGRLAKARPKSPLLRMAEMRKGGLRGRAMRLSESSSMSGNKRLGRKRVQGLESIAEGAEDKESSAVDSRGGEILAGGGGLDEIVGDLGVDEGSGDWWEVLVLDNQASRPEEVLIQPVLMPVESPADLALDLIAAQPLQDMAFIGEQADLKMPEKDCLMLESPQVEDLGGGIEVNNIEQRCGDDDDFPPLNMANLKSTKERERNRGGGGWKFRGGCSNWGRRSLREG